MNRLGPGALFKCMWVCLLLCSGLVHGADERAPNRQPVKAVGDQRVEVKTPAGAGALALYASRRLTDGAEDKNIERAVLVFHGRLRNADVYWRLAQQALRAVPAEGPRTLLIVPQFLAERDVEIGRAHV